MKFGLTHRTILFAPEGGGGGGSGTETVSKAELEAERTRANRLELEMAELRGRLDGLFQVKPTNQSEPPKQYTRAELDSMVAEGKINQAQADEAYEQQVERRAEGAAVRVIEARDLGKSVTAQIDDYAASIPNVLKAGTPERAKVEKEFQILVKNGSPANKATELAALRSAFGDISVVRQAQGHRHVESHQESGGNGGRGDGAPPNRDGVPASVPAHKVGYYQKMIDQGMYRNWSDVETVEKFAGKGKRGMKAA